MNKIFIIIILLSLILVIDNGFAQDSSKIPLTHDVYEKWNRLEKPKISPDGKFITYEINRQIGDGKLIIINTENNSSDTIIRGYDVSISPNSDFFAFKIKPQYDLVRGLKLKKKKKDQLPKDSLGILFNKSLTKYPNLVSFSVPKENTSVIAFINENKNTESKDSSNISFLNIIDPVNKKTYSFKNASEYTFSKNGSKLFYIVNNKSKDADSSSIYIFDTKKENTLEIIKKKGSLKKITSDNNGEQIAFLYIKDSSTVKRYSLNLWQSNTNVISLVADTTSVGMTDGWEVSSNDSPFFFDDGTKLFFQTAPKIQPEPKDSLLDEEKTKVDIWNWNDLQLQTQQIHDLDFEKKKTYLAVYNTDSKNIAQLADSIVDDIKTIQKGNSSIALGSTDLPYQKLISWEDATYKDYYLINTQSGEKKLIAEKKKYFADISPERKYFLWYETSDSNYHCYSIIDDKEMVITKGITAKLFDEEYDLPNDPTPYGIAGWTKSDESVLIYDRYDIWKVNPKNDGTPENITTNGRETKTIYRYVKLDEDTLYIANKMLLKAFNENKYLEGFYSLDLQNKNSLKELILVDFAFTNPIKSKKSDKIIWQKYNYTDFMDLWTSDLNFSNPQKLSLANPQQSKYLWGSVEPVNWKDSLGLEQKGLLYKPENFDVSKKYPMIVYFYEKYTDKIHTHYIPNPSRSVVNFPLYNSNDYIIFIPDIKYQIGHPGKSAYNTIVSGTYAMLEKGFIDKDNIGIQGQSWGGYQVAYLVTQTNIYKSAMSGAPVSNMTSAYGGIRWESGLVREFQYEQGQSRIGKTLWNGLDLYIENSPIFFADRITTPLLIMANDNDGAVPYQQGIEYFTALRRLNKPVWMLTYNGDEHNLTKWPNRVDLAKRMFQFFNYYLKGEPIPVWMSEGVKAIDKGIKTGLEYVK